MGTQRYLYETHMHTSEASACAGSTGAQMARAYKEAGYTGIIVTDHFFYGNTSVDRSLPWEEWVRRFCLGYEHAKAEGERIGLSVFFGWEACYEGTEFLVYGLDQVEKLKLLDLPERPDKATRLRITAKPVSDTKVWIQIRDLGFGELFKSSDKVWDYRMEFSEENP